MNSTQYYRRHPEARRKKQEYDAKLNRRPEQVKKRVESGQERRDAKKAGKDIRGKDYDHATRRFTLSKTNRGRSGEGGRKKGVGHRY